MAASVLGYIEELEMEPRETLPDYLQRKFTAPACAKRTVWIQDE